MKKEIILDSLSKSEEHLNFCPQISEVKDQLTSFKKIIGENNNADIIDFLFTQQGSIFDGKFVLILLFYDVFNFQSFECNFFF